MMSSQVAETDFETEEELVAYVEEHWDACADPAHPPKERDNWRLTEKWFKNEEGLHEKNCTKVTEKLQRSADCLPAGLSMMNLEDDTTKSKVKPVKDRHKATLSKLQGVVNKLGRIITSAESSMPSMKRKLADRDYAKMRSGMVVVRECRETSLDMLEDMRECPEVAEEAEGMIEKMQKLQKDVQEKISTLEQAMAHHNPSGAAASSGSVKAESLPAPPSSESAASLVGIEDGASGEGSYLIKPSTQRKMRFKAVIPPSKLVCLCLCS